MLERLTRMRALSGRVFDRYVHRHLHLTGPGFPLTDPNGQAIGHVDRLQRRGDRLSVIGWVQADRVLLEGEHDHVVTRPKILRADVSAALGIPEDVGFELDLLIDNGPVQLVVEHGGERYPHPVPPFPEEDVAQARKALARSFKRVLWSVAPDIWRWGRRGDPIARARIIQALGLDGPTQSLALDDGLFAGPDPRDPTARPTVAQKITIILPVYNAFSLLPEVLERVRTHTDLPFRLIILEDCSTDPAVRPFLRDWVAKQGASLEIRLEENPENLGFIRSVNKGLGLARAHGDPVVLLNSDAFVPEGWASRLLRPLQTQDNVATVTPMSNDAEIFSVPVICQRTVLAPGQGDAIDAVARGFNPDVTLPFTPTGVGFCMAMNPAFLRRVPALDTAFGRGYGEEVDWCQKVRALGGRHLALPGLFVEHRGGESFGSEAKRALVAANNAVISERYPTYDDEVQSFIHSDPLVTPRLALAVAWIASRQTEAVPVYLAHSMGGGAEKYLERRLKEDLASKGAAIVLRVGGLQRWQIEVHTPQGIVSGRTGSAEVMSRLLAPLPCRHLVYSCGVGDPDPVALPDALLSLHRADQDSLEILFHDFMPISPSYTLLNAAGRYEGPVLPGNTDPAHQTMRPDGELVSLDGWQAAWGRLMAAASEITVFSEDSKWQVENVYPSTSARIRVCPHRLLADVPRVEVADSERCVIGVLGNIGFQKGAALVRDLGVAAAGKADTELVVIGNVDPAYQPPETVRIHGDYQISDIGALVRRYGITCWLIPSIWPETFSFTTHEALATGMPVFCFDIGAQGEAVRKAANGHIIEKYNGDERVPFDSHEDLVAGTLAQLKGDLLPSEPSPERV